MPADPYSTPADVYALFSEEQAGSFAPQGTEDDEARDAYYVAQIEFGDHWLECEMSRRGVTVAALDADRTASERIILRRWSVIAALHHQIAADDETLGVEARWQELLAWLNAGACLNPGVAPPLVSIVAPDAEEICPSIPEATFNELVDCAADPRCS